MMMETSVFDNLIHEIETAQSKLTFLTASFVRKTPPVSSEAKLLEEEISLLRSSGLEGLLGEDGDSGLHYYTAVGEIEREVAELRELSEMTKRSVENNKDTLDNLNKMVEEQRVVVGNLQKETEKGTPMEEAVSEEASKLLTNLKLNKIVLDELKSSLREVVDSKMRTETETGPSCGVAQLLQLLWKQFVTAGPENATLDLSQLDFKADGEDVQQLVQSGIATIDGDNLKLVNFSCDK